MKTIKIRCVGVGAALQMFSVSEPIRYDYSFIEEETQNFVYIPGVSGSLKPDDYIVGAVYEFEYSIRRSVS